MDYCPICSVNSVKVEAPWFILSVLKLLFETFAKKEHVMSIFVDLEKAYDTTWKYGILKNLFHMGLKGKVPTFISNFLSEREFKVRVNLIYSEIHEQEMRVPQRSIFSVTLLSIR